MDSVIKLQPCPFCGSSKTRITSFENGTGIEKVQGYVVNCMKCWTFGPIANSSEQAQTKWNFRRVV